MKKLKRVLSLLLVVCMISGLAVDVRAAETTTDTTVTEAASETVPEGDTEPDAVVETETPASEGESAADLTETSASEETLAQEPTTQETIVESSVSDTVSAAEPADETVPMDGGAAGTSLDESVFYRIFHLDCGRKYFTVAQIKDMIDQLAENDYTHFELAFGNDGLRFLLDDMSITVNGTSYTSQEITSAIQAGNKSYTTASSGELSETEVNEIIAYAAEKNIEIIPLLNSPGHMDSILYACKQLHDPNAAYSGSETTIDVTNENAVAFTQAVIQKYVAYFADKGCKLFNLGADEYNGTSFGELQTRGDYDEYADYVNSIAAIIKNAGMIPMAFNDGIYYNGANYSGNASITFDTDILICYWTSGYGGYYPASAAYLQGKGFQFIHTNESWYYVLGRNDSSWAGYYTAVSGTKNIAVDSMSVDELGAMICVWCDTAGVDYASNAANVSTLISNLAQSNPSYFTKSTEPDPEEYEIYLKVGQSDVRTIDAVIEPSSGNDSDGIASWNWEPGTGTYYQKVDQITSGEQYLMVDATQNKLLTTTATTTKINNYTGIQAVDVVPGEDKIDGDYYDDYLYQAGYTVSDSGDRWSFVPLKSSDKNLRINYSGLYISNTDDNGSEFFSLAGSGGDYTIKDNNDSCPLYYSSAQDGVFAAYQLNNADTWNFYKKVDGTNSTVVTFRGEAVGDTIVIIGGVTYHIHVTDEGTSEGEPQRVELWITNYGVVSTDTDIPATQFATGTSERPAGYYVNVSTAAAHGEEGIALSEVVPATGSYTWSDKLVFWKGTRLTSGNEQTAGAGSDQTSKGDDFAYIRYYNEKWQFSGDRNEWTDINTTDQIVAYYLQKTEVTTQIDTLVKDWGFVPGGTDGNDNQVALSVALVYPDGTLYPAESNIYPSTTTIFNYWENRDIGIVAPLNNSSYEISKITVTSGTRISGNSGIWTTSDSDGIVWEKKSINEDGEQWFDETTYWDETMGTTPMVNGTTSGIIWPAENTAKLVLIYLKPVHYDSNLIVRWVDDSADGALINSMEVVVSSEGTATSFYEELVGNTAELPGKGVGGSFALDDSAYVVDSTGSKQTFNKNISTIPGVDAQYTSGLYQYVSADLSADGMTLTLHYNINSTKLSKNYVVDFGLPVEIPLTALLDSADNVGDVEISGNAAYENGIITYTPSDILTGIDVVIVKITYNNSKTVDFRIGFVPATTVYYEEGFADLTGFTVVSKSEDSKKQTAQIAGQSSDEYGYDDAYANTGVGASNGTQATSKKKNDTAEFTFTGTGVDIYTNSTMSSGKLMIRVKSADGAAVRLIQVDTAMKDGTGDATQGQTVTGYNIPVASISGLNHGSYTVTIIHMDENEVNLDGFRIYGTLAAEPDFYKGDKEGNPAFIELRDRVLASLNANSGASVQYAEQIARNMYSQVYAAAETTEGVIITSRPGTYTDGNLTDLLDNGPKNEIYLLPNQAVTFKIATNREVQVGLKALNTETTCTVNGTVKTLATSTDMFYTVLNAVETVSDQIVTITNNGSGILSITKVKVCDDPTVALVSLTEEDLIPALLSLGFEKDPGITDPEPEPEIPDADATLNLLVVDYAGRKITSAVLTATGKSGEDSSFAAEDILSAVKAALPGGYALVDEDSLTDQTVTNGESVTLKVQAGKTAILHITYRRLFGRTVGEATLISVQTSADSRYMFSTTQIRAAAPAGFRAISLWGTSVKYGSEISINATVY